MTKERRLRGWLPGSRSARGRALYGATVFVVLFGLTGWTAERIVTGMSRQAVANSQRIQDLHERVTQLGNQVWAAQVSFQRYLGAPTPVHAERLWHGLEQARIQAQSLRIENGIAAEAAAALRVVETGIGMLQTTFTASDRTVPAAAIGKAQSAFGDIGVALLELQQEGTRLNQRQTAYLEQGSARLLNAVRTLVVAGLLAVGLGLFFFERALRRPMARTAHALRREAAGEPDVHVPATTLAETQDLASAFNDMRRQVRSRQQRLETILNNAAEGIITFDENGLIETVNRAAEQLFGYTEAEVRSKALSLLIPPETTGTREDYLGHFIRVEIARFVGHEGEVFGRHHDGTRFPMAFKVSVISLEGRKIYTGLVADISERKALFERLKAMAERDGLTGLYNRTYFHEELERLVARVHRHGQTCALLYIDLDNFKYINDTLGHAAGDRLLIDIAVILSKRARKSDLIARLGGDEFAVLLYDTPTEQAANVAESFRSAMANYVFTYGGERVPVGCSIGVSVVDAKTANAPEALSHADVACHLAKRSGRNRVHLFSDKDNDNVSSMSLDMGWSRRIKEAIDQDRFTLACQPIIATATGDIGSYEVLVRLRGEGNEVILPSGFLPAAARFGLAVDVDKWVILHAIETLAHQRQRLPALRFSINLAAPTLAEESAYELIVQRLATTGLPPAALTFEVTETIAIADMTLAASFLGRIRALGCKTALDDFGSGFSSFGYLQDLPVDIVKIDGRFIRNLATSPVDQAMVRAMNEVAHVLGKQTVAECVENEPAAQLLSSYGVDFVQGYHFGRPDVLVPCKDIADLAGAGRLCLS